MSLVLHGKIRHKEASRAALMWASLGLRKCIKSFSHPKSKNWDIRGDIFYIGVGVLTGVFNNYISVDYMDYFVDDGDSKMYCHKYMGRVVRSDFFM